MINVQMVMRCDCDCDEEGGKCNAQQILQSSPYSILTEMWNLGQASRIRNVVVVVVVKGGHFIVPFKKIRVAVSIQRRVDRVPTGVYPSVGYMIIVDPIWVRRIRSR